MFTIETTLNGRAVITNSIGEMITTVILSAGKNNVNLNNVERGAYLVRILDTTGEKVLATKRLIIMN